MAHNLGTVEDGAPSIRIEAVPDMREAPIVDNCGGPG